MIFAEKLDGDPPTWGLRMEGSDEPDVICFDDKVALKIVTLWNADEADRYDKYQNALALERQPTQK